MVLGQAERLSRSVWPQECTRSWSIPLIPLGFLDSPRFPGFRLPRVVYWGEHYESSWHHWWNRALDSLGHGHILGKMDSPGHGNILRIMDSLGVWNILRKWTVLEMKYLKENGQSWRWKHFEKDEQSRSRKYFEERGQSWRRKPLETSWQAGGRKYFHFRFLRLLRQCLSCNLYMVMQGLGHIKCDP